MKSNDLASPERETGEIDTSVAHVARVYDGELREPAAILRAATETVDFSRPVAVMLFGILHFFSDAEDPCDVVGQLVTSLELVRPGVVQPPQWRPEAGTAPAGPLPMWCGVARKAS